MASEFKKVSFKKGDVIMREGDMEMLMYDIIIGSVGVYVNYGMDDEKLLLTLSDGEYFGEMELINVRARVATVVAMENTECMVIDRELFGEYIRNYPEKCLAIMQSLSDKLRHTNQAYREMVRIAREAAADDTDDAKKSSWLTRLLGIVDAD